MISILVDLSNRKEEYVNIGTILLKKEKKKYLFGLITKEIDIECHTIAIKNLQYSYEVVVNKPSELVQIYCSKGTQNVYSDHHQNLHINSHEFKLDIIFNKNQIIDCHSNSINFKGELTFDVEMMKTLGSQPMVRHYTIELTILRGEANLGFDLTIDEPFEVGFEYRKNSKILLGECRVYHCACRNDHLQRLVYVL